VLVTETWGDSAHIGAFMDRGLASVVIPDSVHSIMEGAFWQNPLTSITMPAGASIALPVYCCCNDWAAPDAMGSHGAAFVDAYSSYGMQAGTYLWTGYRWAMLTDYAGAWCGNCGSFFFFDGSDITGFHHPMHASEICMPPEINGLLVQRISRGEFAFRFWGITSVAIPSSVSAIEAGAFEHNPITSITIPAGVWISEYPGSLFGGWRGYAMGIHGAAFLALYNANGRLAGRYEFADGAWRGPLCADPDNCGCADGGAPWCGNFSCECADCAGDACSCLSIGELVRVEGGTFLMGYCPSGASVTPMREVTLSGFYMSRFQVTQVEWRDVMGTWPSFFTGTNALDENRNLIADAPAFDRRRLPVEQVSWRDAIAFSNRLSIMRGLTPAYFLPGLPASAYPDFWMAPDLQIPTGWTDPIWDAVEIVPGSTGYRLPTEAQWEFAARGGIACRGNYIFSGSNNAGEVAWTNENSGRRTHEVGALRPNALGLYDMSGNVWEWVWDRWGTYPSHPETDPAGAAAGGVRVFRGGCWSDAPGLARSAIRDGVNPDGRLDGLGFRVVRP